MRTQEAQRQESEFKREKERKREKEWAIQEATNARALALLEREKARRMREHAVQIRKENELKALEDKKRFVILNFIQI